MSFVLARRRRFGPRNNLAQEFLRQVDCDDRGARQSLCQASRRRRCRGETAGSDSHFAVDAHLPGAKSESVNGAGHDPAIAQASPDDSSSSSSSVRTPSLPPSRGRRRRITPKVHADAEQIRKTQEVKRLIAEGLTFVDASRRAGFT